MNFTAQVPYGTQVIQFQDRQWASVEHGLDLARRFLPLTSRLSWAHALEGGRAFLISVRDTSSYPQFAMAVAWRYSRRAPGFVIWRVRRLTPPGDTKAFAAAVTALTDAAQRHGRVLAIKIELATLDLDRRLQAASVLSEAGFVKRAEPEHLYQRTLVLPLGGSIDALFESLPKKTRRDVRLASKRGYSVRLITSERLVPGLEAIVSAAFGKTGGRPPQLPWGGIVRLSAMRPMTSRLVGIFDTDSPDQREPAAFAWGCVDGDHAHYAAGGVSRSITPGLPLTYPLIWDLICWSKDCGAAWFDMGGIASRLDGTDSLRGISQMKRYFSQHEVDFGEEWVLEPDTVAKVWCSGVSRFLRILAPTRRNR